MSRRLPASRVVAEMIHSLQRGVGGWLDGLCQVLSAECDRGLGVFAVTVRARGDKLEPESRVEICGPKSTRRRIGGTLAEIAHPMLSLMSPPVGTVADMHHWGLLSSEATHEAMRQLSHLGGDVLWVRSIPPSLERGVLVGAPLPLPRRTHRAQLLRLRDYGAEMSAGYAVRHGLASQFGWQAPLGPELAAWLTRGPGRPIRDHSALSEVLRGRWSVLGELCHGGRTHLLALDRSGHREDLRALSSQARAVVPMMVAGDSEATIATALGVGPSATTRLLGDVFGALNVEDRLAAVLRVAALCGAGGHSTEHHEHDLGTGVVHVVTWRGGPTEERRADAVLGTEEREAFSRAATIALR